jgi:hypothetical protein
MKPASRKKKGWVAETQFAQMLVDAGLDKFAMRSPLSGGIKGSFDTDILTKLPFAFEVKNRERVRPYEWYKQAEEANPNRGRLRSVVIMTKNNESMYAFLSADDFLELIYYALKGGLE